MREEVRFFLTRAQAELFCWIQAFSSHARLCLQICKADWECESRTIFCLGYTDTIGSSFTPSVLRPGNSCVKRQLNL